MTTRSRRARRNRIRKTICLESLERREVFAVSLLNPLSQPKFVNPLPNPLDPSFVFQPTGTTTTTDLSGNSITVPLYAVGIRQIQEPLGLVDPVAKTPLVTTVWGYGTDSQGATYPGRTIVAQQGQPIAVHWENQLVDASGDPRPHLLPVDPTLHWADPLLTGHMEGPYTGPVPVVTHLHGGITRSDSDGLPDAWFTPDSNDPGTQPDYTGRLYNPVYTYDNDQPAATLWYHDHALGITRLNVYAGLAGYYLLRDSYDTGLPNNPLGLPANTYIDSDGNGSLDQFVPYEIPLVIQDRMFSVDSDRPGEAQLHYPSAPEADGQPIPSHLPEFFGDHILVNGAAWPVLDVEPRAYRFRLLNGSDSRFYNLWVTPGPGNAPTGPAIVQVGTDAGLLSAPVPLDKLTLAPGERADIVINFAGFAGRTLVMRNNAKAPFPGGGTVNPNTVGQIMAFRVGTSVTVPAVFNPGQALIPVTPLTPTAPPRPLILFEGTDGYGRLKSMLGTVAGGTYNWDEPTTETPQLNSTEVWEIYNATMDAHPIHLHGVAFQVLGRQKFRADDSDKEMEDGGTGGVLSNIRTLGQPKGPAANEAGWKDTVIMYPGEVTRIIATFTRPGEYVWHCHILSHEDHEMMRPYVVTSAIAGRAAIGTGAAQVGPTFSAVCTDPVAYPLRFTTTDADEELFAAPFKQEPDRHGLVPGNR